MHYYPVDFTVLEQQLHMMWQEHVKLRQQFEQAVAELTAENAQLRHKLDSIKPVNIENINYKIQELSVKELSGSLHIGMSAVTDPEQISQWLEQEQSDGGVSMHDMEQAHPEQQSGGAGRQLDDA